MKKLISILITTTFLCGCYNSKKAAEQTHRALDNYKEQTVAIISAQFPCVPDTILKGDSAEIKAWMKATDETAKFYEDLLAGIEPQKIIEKDKTDSEKVVILTTNLENCQKSNSLLKTQLSETKVKIKTLPAIHDTLLIEDTRKVFLANSSKEKAEQLYSSLQEKYDKLQKRAERRARENWIWRIIALFFIAWKAVGLWKNLTTLKIKKV